MNRLNVLEALEEIERACTQQSALCRNRGTEEDTAAGILLHNLGNALFTARNKLRQKWRLVWWKPWTWI